MSSHSEEDYEDKEKSVDHSSIDFDEISKEKISNCVLKTLNRIGSKGGFYFPNFYESVKNDSLPKFVMYFLDIQSIENVHISDSHTKDDQNINKKLKSQEILNIESVIHYLQQETNKFKVLIFNFTDPQTIEISASLFYSNLFNIFFVKTLKKDMYQRVCNILSTHSFYYNDSFWQLSRYVVYIALLHFLIEGNVHFDFKIDYKSKYFNDEIAKPYFEKACIPMIVNEKILDREYDHVTFPVFYQLQFIFNALDSSSRSHHIVEMILKSFNSFREIKVPNSSDIVSSIKAKNESLKFQKDKSKQYLNKNESNNDFKLTNEKHVKKITKVKTRPLRHLKMAYNFFLMWRMIFDFLRKCDMKFF